MKLLFWIIALPLVLLAGLFAISNREPVAIELWPVGGEISMPLFLALALSLYVGFVLGIAVAWLSGSRTRRRARAAERRAGALARENEILTQRMGPSGGFSPSLSAPPLPQAGGDKRPGS